VLSHLHDEVLFPVIDPWVGNFKSSINGWEISSGKFHVDHGANDLYQVSFLDHVFLPIFFLTTEITEPAENIEIS
jgi:hypothetical protein